MADAMNQTEADKGASLPPDSMIILPVRQTVLFPGTVLPLAIGRPASVAAAQEAVRAERPLGVLLQTDSAVDDPTPAQMHRIGTVAQVLRYVTAPDGTHHVICQGARRFRVVDFIPGYPYMVARIEEIGVSEVMNAEIEARVGLLRQRMQEALQLLPNVPAELAAAIESITSASALADFVAGVSDARASEKQEILETIDVKERLDKLLALVAQRIEVLKLSKTIGEQTQQSLSSQQREHILREQLRQIQKELGEGDDKPAEIAELREQIEKADMPKEAAEQAKKELKRLERMPEAAAEYGMVRNYLEWLIELPWSKLDPDTIDVAEARRILDEDHYGLPKVKRRILEYLAVRKLNPEGKSPILCFVGPPGVGKTSLGQSIARAIGRKFVRLSLGGVHDEAEIRGHRRTYIGALPGNIIQSIRKAGTRNPVMMLDEVDKLGQGFHGDPSSALLEVLDPEQNSTFRDNYLGGRLRSLEGDVHRDRERARRHSGPGARPHGGHRTARLHRGREVRDRQALSAQAAARGFGPFRQPMRDYRGGDPDASFATTPARQACARSNGTSAPSAGMSPSASPKARPITCGSTWRTFRRSLGRPGSRTRSPCGPAFRASPPGSPGRRSAAISCSSKRPAFPATTSLFSPASWATS